jgi:hypothetical protein
VSGSVSSSSGNASSADGRPTPTALEAALARRADQDPVILGRRARVEMEKLRLANMKYRCGMRAVCCGFVSRHSELMMKLVLQYFCRVFKCVSVSL